MQTFAGCLHVFPHDHHGTGGSGLTGRVPRLLSVLVRSASQLLSLPSLVGQQLGDVAAGEEVREEEEEGVERGGVLKLGEEVVFE